MGRQKSGNCQEDDCQSQARALQMCWKHYKQFRKFEESIIDYNDFWEFVKKELRIGVPSGRKV